MKMGKFRNRMPHRLIRHPFRSIAPVHMSQRSTSNTRRTGSRERLDSITEYQYHLWIESLEGLREAGYPATDGGRIGGSAEDPRTLHLHDRIDSDLRSHVLDRVIGRKQMSARRNHLEVEPDVRLDGVDGASEQSEIRP
jgi:hypothetical protein